MHEPLLKILGPKEGVPPLAAARLQRWALILSAYIYTLEYTSGVNNKEADMLSRLPIPVDVVDPNEEIYTIDFCEHLPVTATEVATETRQDPVMRRAYEFTLSGWKPQAPQELQPYARRADELTVENGCLLIGNRVIIPPELRSGVLEELHEGHLGVNRMRKHWHAGMFGGLGSTKTSKTLSSHAEHAEIRGTSQVTQCPIHGSFQKNHGFEFMPILQSGE